MSHCNVQGGWPGDGNIDAEPLFVRPPAGDDPGDLRLLPGSPCIDAGDNAAVPPDIYDLDGDGNTTEPLPFDLAGRPRIVAGAGTLPIVDMGAYEYMLDGDCNLDWQISFADFQSFAGCMQGPGVASASGCGCADMDIDGDVDLVDFASFQRAFIGGSP